MPTPPPRTGPDGCPGALQVHAAADGGLVRVRVPGGVLAAPQLAALTRLSGQFSDGSLELTSRGNVQLRGVAPGAEVSLAAGLQAAGLLPSAAHERVRNIIASTLSGRDFLGVLDVRPLAVALDSGLCADPVLAHLPGRFLFTLDDGRGDVAGLGADVGLLACGPDELALLLAGADTGVRVTPADAVATVLAVARAFLDERVAQGSAAWRIAELPHGLPDFGSDRGVRLPIPTPNPVGAIHQRDGRVAIAAVVPLGRLTAAASAVLVDAGEILVTPWRTVVAVDLPPADAESWAARLGSVGLVTDPASPWVGVTACAGRPGCANALADVRTDAAQAQVGAGGPVHWIGCERGCGRPAGRHVQVLATGEGYEVSVDGQASDHHADLAGTVTAARRSL